MTIYTLTLDGSFIVFAAAPQRIQSKSQALQKHNLTIIFYLFDILVPTFVVQELSSELKI